MSPENGPEGMYKDVEKTQGVNMGKTDHNKGKKVTAFYLLPLWLGLHLKHWDTTEMNT